jgi:hypothetical protein
MGLKRHAYMTQVVAKSRRLRRKPIIRSMAIFSLTITQTNIDTRQNEWYGEGR